MKKLFVTYDVAFRLRQLGFNEKCFGFWMVSERTKGKPKLYQTIRKLNADCVRDDTCSAPLYMQVVDWFRDEHKIYISPRESWSFDDTLEFVVTVNGTYVNHGRTDKPINRFDTYYEALEAGIRKALTLI